MSTDFEGAELRSSSTRRMFFDLCISLRRKQLSFFFGPRDAGRRNRRRQHFCVVALPEPPSQQRSPSLQLELGRRQHGESVLVPANQLLWSERDNGHGNPGRPTRDVVCVAVPTAVQRERTRLDLVWREAASEIGECCPEFPAAARPICSSLGILLWLLSFKPLIWIEAMLKETTFVGGISGQFAPRGSFRSLRWRWYRQNAPCNLRYISHHHGEQSSLPSLK